METDLERARSGRQVPALDGVRGVAILSVFGYHCMLYSGMQPLGGVERDIRQLASFGWMGVDLFFVLSGFLITGILLDSQKSATYFQAFYARRVLRIFPLYFASLALFLWALPLLVEMGAGFEQLRSEQIWYWTYLVNLRIASDGWPEYLALGHFWSLAVEEQFYLVWPFVVYVARRETLVKICAGCVVFALALRVVLTVLDRPTAAYVLTPTRLDALAIGALLAVLVRRPGPFPVARLAVRIALAASVLAIAAMFVAQRSLWPETPAVATLGQSVIALAGGSLLAEILLGSGRWRLARLFEHPVLRFVGRYSYGIYVLHHPLIIALGQSELAASEWPRWRGTQVPGLLIASTIAFALSLGAALLSWHALESPFLRMKRFFPYGSDPRVAR